MRLIYEFSRSLKSIIDDKNEKKKLVRLKMKSADADSRRVNE